MATTKNIQIATLLILLAGTGSIALFTNIDFSKPQYYCENRIELGSISCARFSTTGLRCYPNKDNNLGYKDCSIGWTKINKEVTTTTTTPERIINITTTSIIDLLNVLKYKCNQFNCTREV